MLTPSSPNPLLDKAIRALSRVTALPVAFGGPVTPDGHTLVIEHLLGTRTQSLRRLRVATGAGLGGKALALARPSAVTDYLHDEGITHRYDQAVAPEGLRTILALPVRVGSATRAVLYAGTRQSGPLGDRLLAAAGQVVRRFERDLSVAQEVHRRLREAPVAATGALDDLHAELLAIAESITDEAARAKLLAVCRRVRPAPPPPGASLSPREAEMLAHVERGLTNDEIAAATGLLPNTVKSYVKSAMRKLGVHNRIQAVNQARRLGLLP